MRAVIAFTVVLALVVAFGSSGAGASKAPQKAQATDDCMDLPLGPVPDWNIVVMGDLNLMNTDSEGRMVIGRDATLRSSAWPRATRTTPAGSTSRSGAT